MKHYCLCTECHENEEENYAIGEIQSDLIAICKCKYGHISITNLMHDLFDILFKSGIQSYIQGFYSESIMSLTASLERAYELYIKLFMKKYNIDLVKIDLYWKELSNQSERQYGAFCTAYSITTSEVWKKDTKQISFRNRVIHKGYISTSKEAKLYIEYTIGCLNKIMRSIKKDFSDQKQSLYFHMKETSEPASSKALKDNPNGKFSATSTPSLLKWNYANHEDATFEEALTIERKLQQHYDSNFT